MKEIKVILFLLYQNILAITIQISIKDEKDTAFHTYLNLAVSVVIINLLYQQTEHRKENKKVIISIIDSGKDFIVIID